MNTSAYFSVALPGDTTDDQLSKCYEWGKQHCLHCNLLRTCDDEYLLIAHRNDEKDLGKTKANANKFEKLGDRHG